MTADPFEDHVDEGRTPRSRPRPVGLDTGADDLFPDPTAGMVLHRVLAMAARTFLLNDLGDELGDGRRRTGTGRRHCTWPWGPVRCGPSRRSSPSRAPSGGPIPSSGSTRAGWPCAGSAPTSAPSACCSTRPGAPPCGPSSPGTATSSAARDLDLLADRGRPSAVPRCSDAREVARLAAVVDWQRRAVEQYIGAERAGPRRFHLTEQMMILWEGPAFKAEGGRTGRPRCCRPCSTGLARPAGGGPHGPQGPHRRPPPPAADPAQGPPLRLPRPSPWSKGARPARRPGRPSGCRASSGDLHDMVFSIGWLEALAAEQPDLADAAQRLAAVQRAARRRGPQGMEDATSRTSSGAGGAGRADRPTGGRSSARDAARGRRSASARSGTHSRIPPEDAGRVVHHRDVVGQVVAQHPPASSPRRCRGGRTR